MQYFLIENYFRLCNGFQIVDKFRSIETVKSTVNLTHESYKLGKVIWEDTWWDGKIYSNTFNSGTNELNDWRYEIHKHWEDGD